jgi:hypothetical protein
MNIFLCLSHETKHSDGHSMLTTGREKQDLTLKLSSKRLANGRKRAAELKILNKF